MGNYYQLGVATAGSNQDLTTGNAPYSICPKGWTLPATDKVGGSDMFTGLLNKYGLNGTLENEQTGYNIVADPLYYVRAGSAHVGFKALRNFGQTGYVWSGIMLRSNFSVGATGWGVSDSLGQKEGLSVRCVAR